MSPRILPAFLLLVAAVAARAAGASAEGAPFVSATEAQAQPGDALRVFTAARRAMEIGFPGIAADLYAKLLKSAQPAGEDRNALVLDLASALLDDGRAADAAQALRGYSGPQGAGYHVRAGLIAIGQRDAASAAAQIAAIDPGALAAGDRAWFYFLQGQAADAAGNFDQAGDAYQQATKAAVSEAQRAYFILARERARLNLGPVTKEQVATLQKSAKRYHGGSIGYGYARQYAAALAAFGKRADAVEFLKNQIDLLSSGDREVRDDFRLLLGLIDGPENDAGGAALREVLADAVEPEVRLVALQLLAQNAARTGTIPAFLGVLEKVGAEAPTSGANAAARVSPILEDILLVRAELELADTSADHYARAESAAKDLLARFPGSPLKPLALGVLASSAWEQLRYRTAADFAQQAEALLPSGELHASLGVLVAEAYFRAGDFRSAGDAYAEALKDIPPGVSAGLLMAQRVYAAIEDKRLDAAQKLLDGFERDARFDAVNRWSSEWTLARALQAADQTGAALARVDALMAATSPDGAGLPPDLRARLAWLQARLALDAGAPERALALAGKLAGKVGALPPDLRAEVDASARLLQAKAQFQLGRPAQALATLDALRADFPRTDAAVYSYIDEADYHGSQNNFAEAEARLLKLADMLKQPDVLADASKQKAYAAYALYRAALYAERGGTDKSFKDAYLVLERINKEYPQSPLVFVARLRQGDLLRRLNQFGSAQQIYEFLLNNYADKPEELLSVEMALAACHRAQVGADDVSHFESAATIYERVQELPTAPTDMRVEASFQLGDLYATRGRPDDLTFARDTWWSLATTFVLDSAQAAQLGPQGRYWASRALLRLGDLYAQQDKLKQARTAYSLVIDKGLPFAQLARESLARVSAGAGNSTPLPVSNRASTGTPALPTVSLPVLPAPTAK